MDGNRARLDWGGSASSGPRRILRRAFSRTPGTKGSHSGRSLFFVLGAVYTAAGQDNSESNPRYVTISVSGPSSVTVGQSADFTISTNAAGAGYSWMVI